jgi:uncharacterized protein YprB with RNaseH-like and TPR domain
MQIGAQQFLDIAERANALCFWDIESSGGLKGDYGSILCVSIRPWRGKCKTFAVTTPGEDRLVVKRAIEELSKYDLWVGFFSRGFDLPMLQTRAVRWSLPLVPKRHHIDCYYSMARKMLLSHRSQAHVNKFIEAREQKLSVSPNVWPAAAKMMPTIIRRCESDTLGNRDMYIKLRHLVEEITR